MRYRAATFAWVAALGAANVRASCVNPGGTGGCFAAIQDAADAAAAGEVIDVAAGTYAEVVLLAPGTQVTIRGGGAATTVVDGGGSGTAVVEAHDRSVQATIDGLTVRNGTRGIWAENGARLTITDSIVTDTTFMGILCSGARIAVSGSTISASTGPAIDGVFGCRADVSRCTLTGNGAGVSMCGNLTLEDSTISGNGLGIDLSADGCPARARISGSTIADNDGAGLALINYTNRAVARLRSSIVADNGTGSGDCSLPASPEGTRIISRGFNLLEACPGLANPKSSDVIGVDPQLGPLQNNGGPSETQALLPGSPAIGAVTAAARCADADQRGVARAVPCDIGAYEAP